MTPIKETTLSNGKRRLTVELDRDETIHALRAGLHYRLGHPLDDVVPAHIIDEAVPVTWCCIEQKWVT